MEKKQNKESGNGAIIIIFVAAVALTLFLTYFRSLNDNDKVRQLANSAGAIKNLAINDVAPDLEELRIKTQATVAVLVMEGDANVGDAISAGRSAGVGTGFESTVVDTSKGDKVFLGFLSSGGAKTTSLINVLFTANTPGEITGGSGFRGGESIEKKVEGLQDPI